MRISIIGCGYVGLVTGACLAEIGHQVIGADSDPAKVAALKAGKVPIYEPNLDPLVASNLRAGRLSFTGDVGEAIRAGDALFICVSTPPLPSGETDLSALDRAARQIASEARTPKLVIDKSTVPVQTGQQLQRALSIYGRKSSVNFSVCSNPEFLREGTAVLDFLHPDRIVIGVENDKDERMLREVYQPILDRRFNCPVHAAGCPPEDPPPFLVSTINDAELIKHASNSFLALKISYANLLADVCDRLSANVEQVTRAMGLDPRIGPQFLRAGLGFGGSCLPKDIRGFIWLAERVGVDFSLLKEVERINKSCVPRLLEKARKALWVLKEKQIGILGLAYKANTDDIRYAPALDLIQILLTEEARVRAYDAKATEKTRAIFPSVAYTQNPYEVADGADALFIATEWQEFRDLDWSRIRDSMARPLVLDGRNLLDPQKMKALGFEYLSMGRPD